MIKDLIKLAGKLDARGQHKIAEHVDRLIKRSQESFIERMVDKELNKFYQANFTRKNPVSNIKAMYELLESKASAMSPMGVEYKDPNIDIKSENRLSNDADGRDLYPEEIEIMNVFNRLDEEGRKYMAKMMSEEQFDITEDEYEYMQEQKENAQPKLDELKRLMKEQEEMGYGYDEDALLDFDDEE